MHIIRSHSFKRALAIGIGAGIGILYALSAIAANADTLPTVSISNNGAASVHGATVTSVNGDQIIAASKWGNTKITWRIEVTNATKFLPERSSAPVGTVIHVGEVIGFSGLIGERDSAFTVYPSSVRNESVIHEAVVLSGNIIDASESGVVVQTENGTSTVLVGTGTIMTKDGNKARVADLGLGATIKAFGTLNDRDRTLIANRIISITEVLPGVPNTGAAQSKPTWFTRVMAWIGRGGPLSAR